MAAPIVLGVAADSAVLRTLAGDLAAALDGRFRIRTAHSGLAATHLLADVPEGTDVALVLAATHLGDVSGVEFVAAADGLGDAARVLLRQAGDEAAAVDAVRSYGFSRSVVVPWDADADLLPVVEDLLADWVAGHPEPARMITIVGHRWARHAHEVKDFLGGNHIPFRWLDLDRDPSAAEYLASIDAGEARLPVVVLSDGAALADPAVAELATALGMHQHAAERYYDLGIVGAGPAGLAAAVYGGSEGLSTVLVERHAPGGQAGTSSRIENYLGFPAGVSGPDLARRALTQAEKFGVEILAPQEVARLEIAGSYKILHFVDGEVITCGALVIATGVAYKMLNTPGLERLAGAGVYYGAATTEALSAHGEHVYVVGAANSAGQGAMYFSRFAARVTIIFRGAELGDHMSDYLVDQIAAAPNIDLLPESHVTEAVGQEHLEALRIENVATGNTTTVPAEFLFIFVGAEPRNEWLDGLLATDGHGYLRCGPDLAAGDGWPMERDPFFLESNVPGIFVAGDARHGSIRRVAGAVGEGSTSVQLVHRYLAERS